MDIVELEVVGFSSVHSQKDSYILILGECNGTRRIPIIVGISEAQAIVIELEGIKTPRPLTHDLFRTVANELGFYVYKVVIEDFQDGVFYSKVYIQQGEKDIVVDSRTSDAVALAIRFKCPIYTSEDIVVRAGITIEDAKAEDESQEEEFEEEGEGATEEELEKMERSLSFIFDSDEELQERLNNAIEEENYELASLIRDELNSRKSKQ